MCEQMHVRNLGWLPTDCTAELRLTMYVHFYASSSEGNTKDTLVLLCKYKTPFLFNVSARTKQFTHILFTEKNSFFVIVDGEAQ